MSSCRDDLGSTVKRSFSDMENSASASTVSVTRRALFPTPTGFCENYFIAIREKKIIEDTTKAEPKEISNRSCCIFGRWDDAQMYLKQLKLEGKKIEYDAFEGLDAATRYAFGKDALQQDECHPQASDISNMRTKSPFLANYQKMTLKMQPSHDTDDTLSDLERLPQDALTNIYRYLFTNWWRSSNSLTSKISKVGRLSKNMYQTCIRFVRQEPYIFPNGFMYDSSIKSEAFFLGNRARLDSLNIDGTSLTSSCITWLKMNVCDLSILKCLRLGFRTSHGREILVETPHTKEEKWDLVKDGLVSIELVKHIGGKSKEDFYMECCRLIATSGFPSIQKIFIHQFPNSFDIYNSFFLCFSHKLEELHVELNNDWKKKGDENLRELNQAKIKRVEQLVLGAPLLKKLILDLISDFPYDLKVWSKSLDTLEIMDHFGGGKASNVLEINCPLLTTIRMNINLPTFDSNCFVAHSDIRSIKVMHLWIFSPDSGDMLADNIAGRQVSELLSQMTSLKDLHLQFRQKRGLVVSNLPQVERLWLSCYGLDRVSHIGASLKMLDLNFLGFFNFRQLQCNLENIVELNITWESLPEHEFNPFESDEEDEEKDEDPVLILTTLFETIEKRMPKLRVFSLWLCEYPVVEFPFRLKSQSLEVLKLPDEMPEGFQFDCPLLKTVSYDNA